VNSPKSKTPFLSAASMNATFSASILVLALAVVRDMTVDWIWAIKVA
jgi:hypothetical protein